MTWHAVSIQVRVYDMTEGNGFRCLHQVDVSKLVSKLKEAKDSNNRLYSRPEMKGWISMSFFFKKLCVSLKYLGLESAAVLCIYSSLNLMLVGS